MKIAQHILWFLGILTGIIWGCQPTEEEITSDSSVALFYSTDTVTFDTIFSTVGSITKRFRIYNTHDKAVRLNQIYLGRGQQSPYSLTINGTKGKQFDDEVIFGHDSLLVLVEVLIDPSAQDLPFLVKDSVWVQYNGRSENVKLVTWGQDANFINNQQIPCGAIWTKDRPYVIYDSAWVSQDCELLVEPGTRIYIDNGAFLTVAGTLKIQGTAEEKVEIANVRLDPGYAIAPGQWESIFFFPGSVGNIIDHANIKNGTNGLILAINLNNGEGVQIEISNTSIHHMSGSGVAAYSANIRAYNFEVFNCRSQLIAGVGGGQYHFEHCTFSNEPNEFNREGASVGFTNFLDLGNDVSYQSDLSVVLTHSIVWGREEEELAIEWVEGTNLEMAVTRNIIKSNTESWQALGNFISQEKNYPGFYAPNFFNFQLDSLSNARDSARVSTITHDLLGTLRDAMPDIGAYERKDSIP